MKLEDFAKRAGCVVSLNPDPEAWGGKWQYHAKDYPQVTYAGFPTEKSAYKAFIEDTFGNREGKEIIRLLKKVERLEAANRKMRHEKEVRT